MGIGITEQNLRYTWNVIGLWEQSSAWRILHGHLTNASALLLQNHLLSSCRVEFLNFIALLICSRDKLGFLIDCCLAAVHHARI
jgi:hypothetical protein